MNLKGKTVLITAGPTREYIDPVRYISNDSSGVMGFEIANATLKRGAKTIIVAGPVNIETPKKALRINVVSAEEMFLEVKKLYGKADIIICAAAVADWRPVIFSKNKIKKSGEKSEKISIPLKKNPDILEWLGENKTKKQFLVGFALETSNLAKNAVIKLEKKKADLIVANDASVIGNKNSTALLIKKDFSAEKIKTASKKRVAEKIILSILQDYKSNR